MAVGFERLLSVNELNKLHLVFVSQCSSDMEKEFAGNSPWYTKFQEKNVLFSLLSPMRKIRWPEKMATSIDCPSFWYPVISYPGTVVSYPSLSRSVPKFESFRTQVWVVAYPIRWSIHIDINRCVQQISRVKRVRHKEKSVYLWPSRQKQYNYCLTQGKCDIFSWKVYRFYLSLF